MTSSFVIGTVAAAIGFFTLLGTTLFMIYRKTKYHYQNKEPDSSSSSPPPLSTLSTLSPTQKHEVFPSFRGEDVRRDFLSHIQKEFQRKGITAFIDNNIERGESIGPELIRAIRGSKIGIVLLSKNYASSSWCLDELVEIMKCREVLGQKVIVVFYKVDPSHVKKLTGDFGKVFTKTCKGKERENIERWREAFAKVATVAGYDSSNWNNEAEMIETIACDISTMLYHSTPLRDFDGLVGMEAHMEKMGPLLDLDSDEVRMIGIWGPPGIGKTTIARFLFSKRSHDFNLSVFMENVKGYTRQVCSDDYSLKLHLHQQLISQIFKQKDIEIPHLGVAQDRLQDKKVLVVLDDVDRSVQLDAMAKETRWFGPGSRIIITTQDRRLLRAHQIENIYKVGLPATDEALQIFCMNAFGQNSPKDGFEKLAWEVTYLAGELPLGLKIMGSYFKNMCKQDCIEAMPRLRTHLNSDIQSILNFSYDALDDQDKDLFLHIACFFENETPETVEKCLEKNFSNVRHGICVLTEKSLISIDPIIIGGEQPKIVKMHNLLVQLGREIVRKQCIHDPGKRRFLVDGKEICEVLTDDTGSRSVLGLNTWFFGANKSNISKKAFNGLSNLQFLRFAMKIVYTPPDLNNLPRKLKFLKWVYYPLTCMPSEFHTEFLVKLVLKFSKLEKLWEGIQPLQNLIWMDLSFSKDLKELPDLSTASNLQELNLNYCSSLVKLPSSIGNATSLVTLDLGGCSKLVELPSTIGNATSLVTLILEKCMALVELPSAIGNATSLETLNLDCCKKLVELPSTIGNLQKLSKLTMRYCSKLESLPTNINSESLKELVLRGCSLLKNFPQVSTNIEYLNLCETKIEGVTSSIMRFSRLRKLWLGKCSKLVSIVHLPESLQLLGASNCKSLETLDWSSHNSEFGGLYFHNCFKLNNEARDLIIKTSTRDYAILPGVEVPAYIFTYRAIGDSVTVNLNGRPFPTPFRFKFCVLLAYKDYNVDYSGMGCYMSLQIMDKHNGLTVMFPKKSILFRSVLKDHLCIFEDEANVEFTSRELVFEFKIKTKKIEVRECGVKLQLMEDDERDQESDKTVNEDGDDSIPRH